LAAEETGKEAKTEEAELDLVGQGLGQDKGKAGTHKIGLDKAGKDSSQGQDKGIMAAGIWRIEAEGGDRDGESLRNRTTRFSKKPKSFRVAHKIYINLGI
jgi:hypothetical protein